MEISSIFEINTNDLFSSDERYIAFPFMSEVGWDIQFYNTGRSAIEAIFKANDAIHRFWVPSFICSSVIDAISRAGKEIKYYPIDRELHINADFIRQRTLKKEIFFIFCSILECLIRMVQRN